MNKKILVALDDSKNAMRAVKYVASHFTTDHRITLISVLQDVAALCKLESPELTPHFISQQTSFCTLEDEKRKLVENAQQKAKAQLIEAGFNEKSITTKIESKQRSVARDIVTEAADGYDVIVIGRRGLTGLKEFFMGSVSHKILNLAKDISVLIVN